MTRAERKAIRERATAAAAVVCEFGRGNFDKFAEAVAAQNVIRDICRDLEARGFELYWYGNDQLRIRAARG